MTKRIQMTRSKPWRKENPDAVIVARPTKWGNPFAYKDRQFATQTYRQWMTGDGTFARTIDPPTIVSICAELRGKDLACWCPLDGPCHADVLLELANK